MALGSTQHPKYFLEGKGGRCVGPTTLTFSCADCHEWDNTRLVNHEWDTTSIVSHELDMTGLVSNEWDVLGL